MDKLGEISRDQWKGLFTIAFAFISRFFITALLEPFYPPEGRLHGVSISLNGMIMSTTFVVYLFTSSAVGMLVAFFGPRRGIMIGTAINVASMTSFGFLQFLNDFVAFTTLSFILIGIHAFGSVCVSISAVTMGAKLFPNNISLIIGSAEFCVAVGETISLLTSGVIYDAGGFYLPFLVFSLIHAFSIPIAYFMLPSEEPHKPVGSTAESNEEIKIRPWHLLKIPRTMIIALLLPLNGACWAFQGANLEKHLAPLELTKTQVNLMFLLTSATYGVVCPIIGWMADKLERKWPPISIGLIGAGIGMIFLGPLPLFGLENTVAQNVAVLTLVSVLLAVCTVPGFQTIILCTIAAGHENNVATYAVATSLISTTDPIGHFGGSFGGGFLVENFGFPTASAIVGAAMAGAGMIIGSFFILCDVRSPRAIPQVAQGQHIHMESYNVDQQQNKSLNRESCE